MKDPYAELVKRRHPLYEAMCEHWNFVEATYEGGRAWFKANIFRFEREGNKGFADRVDRAYRFNHTKQVVDLMDRYLFKMPVARKEDDASEPVKAFWKNATLQGLDIDTYMKRVSSASSQFGRIWCVVDSNSMGGTASVAEAMSAESRIYSYFVKPQDALDMGYDEMDRLTWILLREIARDDGDPLTSSGAYIERFRLWTRHSWMLLEARRERGKTKIVLVDQDDHELGEVPVFPIDHNFCEDRYVAPGLADDIAYLDRAIANYLSNLDQIIQDQTFSQLTMPAQGMLPGSDEEQQLLDMGTKRIFTYNGEAGQKPEYISPDPKQAELIVGAIGKIINEIYHSVGLAAARTKEDNGGGVDNASGVAKAYDFDGVNALLAAKAASLERAERRMERLARVWAGENAQQENELVTYPRDFDVRGLYDEFEIGARLSLLMAPDEVRREQMRTVVKKLFPAASKELQDRLEKALKEWPPEDPLLEAGGLGNKTNAKGPIAAAGTQKTAKELAA